MLCELSSAVTQANYRGLTDLVGLMMKCWCLQSAGLLLLSNKVGVCGTLLSSGQLLSLLIWWYDLAHWYLGFWNSQDVFPSRSF